MAVSIRRGKLAPSFRSKPAASFTQGDTNWRIGISKPSYTTTYVEANAQAGQSTFKPVPRIDKNASTRIIQGDLNMDPKETWNTISRSTLSMGVGAPSYERSRPQEGFCRLTANRTNYSLGKHKDTYDTSTGELQFTHPDLRPKVDQPTFGGWHRPDGTYFTDQECAAAIRRGGGGGQGCMGVGFDVITGQEDRHARRKAAMRAGPRMTLNVQERDVLHPTDRWGEPLQHVNEITGRPIKHFKAKPSSAGPAAAAAVGATADAAGRDSLSTFFRTRPW